MSATTAFAPLQEALDFLQLNPDIEMFKLFIIDNNGVPRGKLLHRDELLAVYESGRPLPSTILGLSINGDDVENTGLVWDVGDIDCRAYPISGSLQRMPWRLIPTAAVQVSMHPQQGMPATVADPRHLLARVIDDLKADGYYPVSFICSTSSVTATAARNRPAMPMASVREQPRSTACASWSRSSHSLPICTAPASSRGYLRARRFPNMRRGRWKSPWSTAGQGRGAQARHAGLLHGQAL